jgi:hypothetical protein
VLTAVTAVVGLLIYKRPLPLLFPPIINYTTNHVITSMVARPNTDVWYGVPVSNDDLHRLYRASRKDTPHLTYLGTRPDWTLTDGERQAHGKSELDFHAFIQSMMMDIAGPLYEIVDAAQQPVPVRKWWDRYDAPLRLLGYPWDAGKSVLIALERPALEAGDVEEGEHVFKPFDAGKFARIEAACEDVVPELLAALRGLGVSPGPVGWYRHEYTL